MNDEPGSVLLAMGEARALAERALTASGCDEESAALLAAAMLAAEGQGYPGVGLAHLLDYCDGLVEGRINGRANPVVTRPRPAVIRVDADRGIPHLGYERCLDELVGVAGELGVGLFLSCNAFTCAGLGYFTERLAERGLLALAMTNGGPALMAGSGTTEAVFCTNPVSFAAPRGDRPILVIDQSCSATAYVNIREAARDGRTIPPDWALDSEGRPTTDPRAALAGTLLPAGGSRGANLALIVELLAAGLAGAEWSVDAPSAFEGSRSPGTGLVVLAVDPTAGGEGALLRTTEHLLRLGDEFGAYLPGERRAQSLDRARHEGVLVARTTVDALIAHGSR